MACTKTELVSAINSYASARITNDQNLIQYSGDLVSKYIETLEFAEEPPAEEALMQILMEVILVIIL